MPRKKAERSILAVDFMVECVRYFHRMARQTGREKYYMQRARQIGHRVAPYLADKIFAQRLIRDRPMTEGWWTKHCGRPRL
jgi:hypothetical protein